MPGPPIAAAIARASPGRGLAGPPLKKPPRRENRPGAFAGGFLAGRGAPFGRGRIWGWPMPGGGAETVTVLVRIEGGQFVDGLAPGAGLAPAAGLPVLASFLFASAAFGTKKPCTRPPLPVSTLAMPVMVL